MFVELIFVNMKRAAAQHDDIEPSFATGSHATKCTSAVVICHHVSSRAGLKNFLIIGSV